jgi:metallo-beta-lactamase class B
MAFHRFVLFPLFAVSLAAQSTATQWSQPFPPHRVAGNLYYVGSSELSSFLITTPEGHILINSSFEETVPVIRAGVEKLGFNFRDIKILLTSHAHADHVAGHTMVKSLTGAKVMVMEGDEGTIASGDNGEWKPCKVDRVLHDGDEVTLGGVTLTAHHTPGHTPGATTWTLPVSEGGKTYQALVISSVSVNTGYNLVTNVPYPHLAESFSQAYRVLKALPCDVFLAPHGSQYGMKEKFARMGKGGGNPFVDPEGYRTFLRDQEAIYLSKLKEHRRAAGLE